LKAGVAIAAKNELDEAVAESADAVVKEVGLRMGSGFTENRSIRGPAVWTLLSAVFGVVPRFMVCRSEYIGESVFRRREFR
jgi:hypothetical protein